MSNIFDKGGVSVWRYMYSVVQNEEGVGGL